MYIFRGPYPNELWHHGIKNQHWGVRNGPPYPLDRKTASRIKAGKNEKVRVSNKEYQQMRNKKLSSNKRSGTTHYVNYHESRLQEVINASDLPEPINVTEMIKDGRWNPETHPSKTYQYGRHGHLALDDVKLTNPGYGQSDEAGLYNNCVKCTSTLEMRRRGYDVYAGRSAHGMLNSASQYYWDGAVPYKEKFDNIQSRLDSFGRGGTGEFIARRSDGTGHSVYFMKEKVGNEYKQFFVDGQDSRIYNSLDSLYEAQHFDKTQFAQITRLDNATPNYDHMAEDSVLRVSYKNQDMNRIIDRKQDNYMFGTGKRWTG